jgi:hypothetical protein
MTDIFTRDFLSNDLKAEALFPLSAGTQTCLQISRYQPSGSGNAKGSDLSRRNLVLSYSLFVPKSTVTTSEKQRIDRKTEMEYNQCGLKAGAPWPPEIVGLIITIGDRQVNRK